MSLAWFPEAVHDYRRSASADELRGRQDARLEQWVVLQGLQEQRLRDALQRAARPCLDRAVVQQRASALLALTGWRVEPVPLDESA